MKCTKCKYYSYKLARCRYGKVQPKTVEAGVKLAKLVGMNLICSLSPNFNKIFDCLMRKEGG